MDVTSMKPSEYYTNRFDKLNSLLQKEDFDSIERVCVEVVLEGSSRRYGRVEMESVNTRTDNIRCMRFSIPRPYCLLPPEAVEEVKTYCKSLGLYCSSDESANNRRICEFLHKRKGHVLPCDKCSDRGA